MTTADINSEARRLIDDALADLAGVNLVEASDMTDLLLDLRLLLFTSDETSCVAE